MLKKLCFIFGSFVILLISFCVYRLTTFHPIPLRHQMPEGYQSKIEISDEDIDPILMSKALTFKTITFSEEKVFDDMFQYLEDSLPDLTKNLEIVNDFKNAKIYKWNGTDPSLKKNPIVYLAHADIVPVEREDLKDWHAPPFSGEMKEDGDTTWIYGRGALDYKIGVVAMMDAFDKLAKLKFRPKRDTYLIIGCDEETLSGIGQRRVSEYFRKNGIRPKFILDEGGTIFKNFFKNFGFQKGVGMIQIAERGMINVNVSVSCVGGHASMPPLKSACSHKISRIIQKVIDNPVPPKSDRFLIPFVDHIFPHVGILGKALFAVLRAFPNYFIEVLFSQNQGSNAMLRSTIAPTLIKMGKTFNVLPNSGWIMLNVRVNPDDTVEGVIEHIQNNILSSESGVEISNLEDLKAGKDGRLSKRISKHDCVEFEMIVRAMRDIFEDQLGEIVFTPSVMIGGSDLFYYRDLSDYAYNFLPVIFDFDGDDVKRIHGNNERISVDSYRRAVKFYALLIKNLQLLE